MRRLVSISLLVLFSITLIMPLFASNAAEANLPACCRKNGIHHCMMNAMVRNDATNRSAPQLSTARERCPCGAALAPSATHGASNAPARSDVKYFYSGLAMLIAEAEAQYRISFDRSRQKRGPPCLSLFFS